MSPRLSTRYGAKRPSVIGWCALALLLIGFGGWSTQARIEGAILAAGAIEVKNSAQIIQHPKGGVISEIHIHEGDEVQAGQILISLDDQSLRMQEKRISWQIAALLAKEARLIAESQSTDDELRPPRDQPNPPPALFEAFEREAILFSLRRDSQRQEITQIDEQIHQTAKQIDGMESQLRALNEQILYINEELTKSERLEAQGLIEHSRILALRRERARLMGNSAEEVALIARLKTQIATLELEKIRRKILWQEEAMTALRELALLKSELLERQEALAHEIEMMQIRAPRDGIIDEMRFNTQKGVISAAEPILSLIPLNQPLVIIAAVPAHKIQDIVLLQPAYVQINALNTRSEPPFQAHVTQIGADAKTDPNTREIFYKITLKFEQSDNFVRQSALLLSGMPVQVHFRTQTRSPWSYVTSPLVDYMSKAFR